MLVACVTWEHRSIRKGAGGLGRLVRGKEGARSQAGPWKVREERPKPRKQMGRIVRVQEGSDDVGLAP